MSAPGTVPRGGRPKLMDLFKLAILSLLLAPFVLGTSDHPSVVNLNNGPRVKDHRAQHPISLGGSEGGRQPIIDDGRYHPRIDYSALEQLHDNDETETVAPKGMKLHPLQISGRSEERVDLTFFADGYTIDEEDKFISDAKVLTDDIVANGGAMAHVAGLLNVWAVFVPSNTSGIGTHDVPLPGAAFGLYRSGAELRGVYVQYPKRARAGCRYWREQGQTGSRGGCDQAIILGNDPLYGGLGGEFTIITASKLNGPLVLRHELGHSLIPVGEEYEGGFAYFGVNSDKVDHVGHLKWKRFLTDPNGARIEDVKVPLQEYPWQDLSPGAYNITFRSSNTLTGCRDHRPYPSAHIRLSLSSIPYPEHISFILNGQGLNLTDAFLPEWDGSKDRRWLEVTLPNGLPAGENQVVVALSEVGRMEPEGQGGKMITSLEIMEYGGDGWFNGSTGFIGAFPTYSMDGKVTLRPTNEECLMRKVNHPTFCPVCAAGLEKSLKQKISRKQQQRRLEEALPKI